MISVYKLLTTDVIIIQLIRSYEFRLLSGRHEESHLSEFFNYDATANLKAWLL